MQHFSSAKMLLGQEPIQMDDVTTLRETLLNKPAGGINIYNNSKFSLKKRRVDFLF